MANKYPCYVRLIRCHDCSEQFSEGDIRSHLCEQMRVRLELRLSVIQTKLAGGLEYHTAPEARPFNPKYDPRTADFLSQSVSVLRIEKEGILEKLSNA